MRIKISMTLPREAASVPLARRTVAEALQYAGVDPDCVDEARVALSEACTNVYHHAGAGHSYTVVIDISETQLTMDILDSGPGISELQRTAPMPGTGAENGRGLALITEFSDYAVFDAVGQDGGAVHLTKNLRWTQNTPTTTPAVADSNGSAAP